MAVCRMADRQKSNMRTPEKWINVDESFAKKYQSLYQTITQMPEFIEHNKKAEAGISKAGNVKLLWALQVQTILTKQDLLESVSLQKDYVQYASDFGKPVPINEVQRNKWGRWLSTSEVETQILPQLREHIRQKLGKPDWKFQLDVENIGKKKEIYHIWLNADELPVVLAANQGYVPILYTCLQSIADHISEQRDYKIYIFHTDIEPESQNEIRKLKKTNFDVSFVNVRSRVAGYQLKAKEHISTETFYRFLILDILKMYPKVVYLDCDMIIRRDIAELYDVKLGDNMLAAVIDPDFAGQCNGANADTLAYCRDVLKLKDPLAYFQAGVLVFHMGQIADKISVQKLFEMSDTGIYKYSDQDILNIVCEGKVTYLNMQWNVLTDCNNYSWQHVIKSAPYYVMDAYENARKDPYIIHYAGAAKPWKNPKDDFAKEFWKVARKTPYYEELLYDMCGQAKEKIHPGKAVVDVLRKAAKKILPQGSWIRRTVGNLYWKLK